MEILVDKNLNSDKRFGLVYKRKEI